MATTSSEINPHAPAYSGATSTHNPHEQCPCGSTATYERCCAQYHTGAAHAPTPEALMRSRYSAFALGLTGYLKWTWATETCPKDLELDPKQNWTRLRILAAPPALHVRGTVHFRAHYKYGTQRDFLEEDSRFEIRGGRWVYVDGDVHGD